MTLTEWWPILVLTICATVIAIKVIGAIERGGERGAKELRDVAQTILTIHAAGLGVSPHALDPKKFGPSGMAREDEEKLAAQKKQEREEQASEEEQALREAEAKFRQLGISLGPDKN